MATRHLIAIENQDNTVCVIYSHWGGDPDNVGKILYEHFSDREKLKELLALGNIANLYPRLHPVGEHHFDSPEKETTITFHRDRGDDWEREKPKTLRSVQELLETFTKLYHPTVEYIYVFTKKARWVVYTTVGQRCPGNPIREKRNLAAILKKGKDP